MASLSLSFFMQLSLLLQGICVAFKISHAALMWGQLGVGALQLFN